ncbi:MAG: DUF479 domain-containing protein [Desulfuromonas sp.]|nr:MAG: DUF479 domain-containing protein [Desulfuromonas sp.]
MNYLVHLYLSDPEPKVRLGNLMGDFVKGDLSRSGYDRQIIRGLSQHRTIDSFCHVSRAVRESKNRIDKRFGYFRGILVDVFYDHFLARNWSDFSVCSLETFAEETYQLLRSYHDILPERLQQVAPRMISHNWLVSYREVAVIEKALLRIGQRLSRANPLAEGYTELLLHYDELEADAALFLDEARTHLAALGDKAEI